MTLSSAVTRLHVHVTGTPVSQGSKRHIGRGILIESSKHLRPWRDAVKHAAQDVIDRPYPLGRGPLKVTLAFILPRPKLHYRTGARDHELRDHAPMYVTTRPDLDKLARACLDALSDAAVWYSDAQVVALYASKMYATNSAPGVDILVDTA